MLFSSVRYAISPSLSTQRQNELAKLLDANGATMVDFAEATHVVANSLQFEGRELTSTEVYIITGEWVDRSIVHGKLQDPKIFSADPLMIFSGVIACASDLEACDREVISAGINALGGLFREGYTRDCTHVLAANSRSDKYMTAMHYKEATKVKVVLPHWFDDCFKLLIRLPEDPYAWPNPTAHNRGAELTKARLTPTKKALVKAAVVEDEPVEKIAALVRTQTDIWHGKRILLSSYLKLEKSRRQAVEASVQRAGGVPVLISSDEVADIDSTDIYIIQHRIGIPFVKAIRTNKIVGTLSWLFNVHKSGVVTSPLDQLVHFPTYPNPVSGFEKHKVTATNYEGDARRYLKKLIELMGGEFTPQMTASNTVVVAAYLKGEKTTKAREWDIPVVNHTWLEDCFAAWMLRTPAQEKYVSFPASVNFGTLVGTRNVSPITEEELDDIERISEEIIRKQKEALRKPKESPARPVSPVTKSSPTRRVLQTSSVTLNRSQTGADRIDSQITPSKPARIRSTGVTRGEPIHQRSQGQVNGVGAREEEEEEEEDPRRTKNRPQKRARESDEENDAEPEPISARGRSTKSISPAKLDSKSKPRIRASDENERELVSSGRGDSAAGKSTDKPRIVEVDSEVEDSRKPQSSRSARPSPIKGRARPRVVPEEEEDSDDDLPAHIVVPMSSKSGNKPTSKTVVGAKSKSARARLGDDGLTSSSEDGLSPIKPTKKTATPASKASAVESQLTDAQDDDEEEENERPITSRVRKRENAAAGPSKPRHTSPESQKTPLRKRSSLPGPTPGKDVFVEIPSPKRSIANLHQTDSIVIAAADKAADHATPKRGRANARARTPQRHESESGSSLSPIDSPSRVNRLNGEAIQRSSQPTPIISIPGLQRTPSKRSAASKAAQKLHENALDINKFEKEKRSGRFRGAWEDVAGKGEVKGEPKAEESRKRRVSAVQAESDEEEPGPKSKKKRKSDAGLKKVKRDASSSVTDGEEEPQVSEEESEGSLDLNDIRLLTTQVTLSEQVLKTLQKLGVKMASKPTDCNLLVANNIGRTEKFLCAMASAQYIVTEAWATDSAEAKRILSPEMYFLKDPEGEKRHKFKLADALRRAQSSEKKLLVGHTFYFTKGLFRSDKLPTYRSVINSAGGKSVVQSNPTVRILKGHADRHVISTEGDESVTDPLVEGGFHVYTPEFILMGVLTQRMDWDTTPHRLDKN